MVWFAPVSRSSGGRSAVIATAARRRTGPRYSGAEVRRGRAAGGDDRHRPAATWRAQRQEAGAALVDPYVQPQPTGGVSGRGRERERGAAAAGREHDVGDAAAHELIDEDHALRGGGVHPAILPPAATPPRSTACGRPADLRSGASTSGQVGGAADQAGRPTRRPGRAAGRRRTARGGRGRGVRREQPVAGDDRGDRDVAGEQPTGAEPRQRTAGRQRGGKRDPGQPDCGVERAADDHRQPERAARSSAGRTPPSGAALTTTTSAAAADVGEGAGGRGRSPAAAPRRPRPGPTARTCAQSARVAQGCSTYSSSPGDGSTAPRLGAAPAAVGVDPHPYAGRQRRPDRRHPRDVVRRALARLGDLHLVRRAARLARTLLVRTPRRRRPAAPGRSR